MSLLGEIEDGVVDWLKARLSGWRSDAVIAYPGWSRFVKMTTPGTAVVVGVKGWRKTRAADQYGLVDIVAVGQVWVKDQNLRGVSEQLRGSGVTGEGVGLFAASEAVLSHLEGQCISTTAGMSDGIETGDGELMEFGEDIVSGGMSIMIIDFEVVVKGVEVRELA